MANTTKIVAEPYKQEFHIIREFGAPCELDFEVDVDPAIHVKWVRPKG